MNAVARGRWHDIVRLGMALVLFGGFVFIFVVVAVDSSGIMTAKAEAGQIILHVGDSDDLLVANRENPDVRIVEEVAGWTKWRAAETFYTVKDHKVVSVWRRR